mmetsp:Transcript_15845/g.40765  ORF Transcript_15845/g.40765 Transcript_15845/m.40765 type:complete len:222 (-) Transcript_15845:41-706(-)
MQKARTISPVSWKTSANIAARRRATSRPIHSPSVRLLSLRNVPRHPPHGVHHRRRHPPPCRLHRPQKRPRELHRHRVRQTRHPEPVDDHLVHRRMRVIQPPHHHALLLRHHRNPPPVRPLQLVPSLDEPSHGKLPIHKDIVRPGQRNRAAIRGMKPHKRVHPLRVLVREKENRRTRLVGQPRGNDVAEPEAVDADGLGFGGEADECGGGETRIGAAAVGCG